MIYGLFKYKGAVIRTVTLYRNRRGEPRERWLVRFAPRSPVSSPILRSSRRALRRGDEDTGDFPGPHVEEGASRFRRRQVGDEYGWWRGRQDRGEGESIIFGRVPGARVRRGKDECREPTARGWAGGREGEGGAARSSSSSISTFATANSNVNYWPRLHTARRTRL